MKRAAEVLNVPLHQVDELPLIWKLKALAYVQVMDKTRPALEEAAKAKARQQHAKPQQTMASRKPNKPGDINSTRRR